LYTLAATFFLRKWTSAGAPYNLRISRALDRTNSKPSEAQAKRTVSEAKPIEDVVGWWLIYKIGGLLRSKSNAYF